MPARDHGSVASSTIHRADPGSDAGFLRIPVNSHAGGIQDIPHGDSSVCIHTWPSCVLGPVVFCDIIVWQFLTVTMFGWALMTLLREGAIGGLAVNAAFACGLGLGAAFMIADKIFKAYDTQRSRVLFCSAELVTLLALRVLPS